MQTHSGYSLEKKLKRYRNDWALVGTRTRNQTPEESLAAEPLAQPAEFLGKPAGGAAKVLAE